MLTRFILATATLIQVWSLRTRGQDKISYHFPCSFLTTSWVKISATHHQRSSNRRGNKSLKSVRGIRTFNPTDYAKREYIFKKWKELAKAFSYSFYDLPVLEDYNIFQKTKINEAYDFVKNKRHLILRPEITPQLVRHLFVREERTHQSGRQEGNEQSEVAKQREDNQICENDRETIDQEGGGYSSPLQSAVLTNRVQTSARVRIKPYRLHNLRKIHKVSTIGQCFRYERTSNCRKREHYQWNMDIIGTDLIDADIEILTILISFFRRVHLLPSDVVIKINDKRIVSYMIKKIFKSSLREFSHPYIQQHVLKNILHNLDKYKKISSGIFKFFIQRKMPYLQRHEVTNFFNIIGKIKNLPDLATFFYSPGEQEIFSDLHNVLNYFQQMNLNRYFELDLTIVRGMDYYTNIIFESFYRHKEYRAICGGGRYSYVLNEGQRVCAVGFGMGDVVITEILFNNQERHGGNGPGNLADEFYKNVDVVSFSPSRAQHQPRQKHSVHPTHTHTQKEQVHIQKEHFHIVDTLRRNGVRVYSLLQGSNNNSLSKALKKANSLRANFFFFFDEHSELFILKDLRTGGQHAVTPEDVLSVYSSGISLPSPVVPPGAARGVAQGSAK
ncbi:histidine--tRNA ligase, putative [Plasmodium knowlesi strain H]|uniref:histidine--tRNA ligase n=3 Tax=Plasmodium knowlesi TaxID=5850 RepID=A0A5K1UKN8_PLAKH|nr:histidine--tRNA ligase, putative [Plasmodium knowlesi strain H]OTN67522.1 putative Histidine--tRNA ligase [Plasmodium knowlesi]CAA9987618.1 histidine--tRNA ligase, putative [Plasmodium knowlesi strain H]SBO26982.1 histidine--tRNA ligase, putative [Plasmodium knowlesi strain H]SBO29255.1 histidine--tRNA ligase, putative [Plasmodium knowlesi strain H]VVS77092.1 histidine--tRNA ligase, putative [Plasmodium knowlesi strain H]|eukprot:XP_002258618.1 hypothetical protein, conserved in Plasmodium species [Plasmodium knowlesi strain H]